MLNESVNRYRKRLEIRVIVLFLLKDKRDFLELEIKNHVLELQNIELEINL